MKADCVLIAGAAGLALVALSSLTAEPKLVWNRTTSMPVGFYAIGPRTGLVVGDVVAFQPEDREADWLQSRRYTGRGWPLIKRIAALAGDEVCREGQSVHINGDVVALALAIDSSSRALPVWQGCIRLAKGDAFLLSDHARSVDGRYFGVQPVHQILGKATHLWPTRQGEMSTANPVPELSGGSGSRKLGSTDDGPS